MLAEHNFNGRTSYWHVQLDGGLMAPERCACIGTEPRLDCPIDDHKIRWLQRHPMWTGEKPKRGGPPGGGVLLPPKILTPAARSSAPQASTKEPISATGYHGKSSRKRRKALQKVLFVVPGPERDRAGGSDGRAKALVQTKGGGSRSNRQKASGARGGEAPTRSGQIALGLSWRG